MSGSACPVETGTTADSLRFFSTYKHRGSYSTIAKSATEEVMVRAAIIQDETKRLRNRILLSKALSLKTKIIILNTYIFSKGTYNCGTWPPLLRPCLARFHNTIMNLYRVAVGNYFIKDQDNTHLLTDADIIYENSLLSPTALIRLSRVSLLCRIVLKDSSYVLGLVDRLADMPSGWIQAIREDFALVSHHPHCFVFNNVGVRGIIGILSQDPRYWYNTLRKTLKLPYFSIHYESRGPGPPSPTLNEDPVEPPAVFTCDVCGKVEPTYKKLRYHMFRFHQIKNPVRRLFSGVICPVCQTFHHTRERLFEHLKPDKHGPGSCLNILNQRGPILTQKQSNNLDAEDRPFHVNLFKKGRRRNYAEYLIFPVCGPVCPIHIWLNNPNNNPENIVLQDSESESSASNPPDSQTSSSD